MSKRRFIPGDIVKLSPKGIGIGKGAAPWDFVGDADVGAVDHVSAGVSLYYVRFFTLPDHVLPYLADELELVEAGDVQVQGG